MVIQFLGCNSDFSQELPLLAGILQLPRGRWSQDIYPCCPCPFHSLQKNASIQTFAAIVCQVHLCFIISPHLLKCINSGFFLELSQCVLEGRGGHRDTEIALLTEPWGYVCLASSRWIWACFSQKLHTRVTLLPVLSASSYVALSEEHKA